MKLCVAMSGDVNLRSESNVRLREADGDAVHFPSFLSMIDGSAICPIIRCDACNLTHDDSRFFVDKGRKMIGKIVAKSVSRRENVTLAGQSISI